MRNDDFDISVRCPDNLLRLHQTQIRTFDAIQGFPSVEGANDGRPLERLLAPQLQATFSKRGETSIPFHLFDSRPAVEPVLIKAWPNFVATLSRPSITDLLSNLLGEPAVERQGLHATLRCRDGTRSVFPAASDAAGWLDRVGAAEAEGGHPFALACFAYAQTVLSHPYRDGNGRLARAMFQRSLGRSGLLGGPFLPLGPLVYANHRVHDRALQHLGSTGEWDPFVSVMLGLTRKAAAFSAWTLSGERSLPYETP